MIKIYTKRCQILKLFKNFTKAAIKLRDEESEKYAANVSLEVLNLGSHYGYSNFNYSASDWCLQCAGKSAREIFLQVGLK